MLHSHPHHFISSFFYLVFRTILLLPPKLSSRGSKGFLFFIFMAHECFISPLQLSQVQLERQSCPHCSKGVEPDTPTGEEGAIIGSGEELQPLDVSTSKAILSQLQAMRTQVGDSPPTINGRELDESDSSSSATATLKSKPEKLAS